MSWSLFVTAFVCHWLGWVFCALFKQRRIDHRWYCGQFHRADQRCEPSDSYEWRSRLVDDNLKEAEILERRVKTLRKYPDMSHTWKDDG